MFRLTWRNLLARKIRLLMSALAIVLGIGFLAGVLTFSSGLSKTFDGIIQGSTPDAQARPAGTDSFSAIGAGGTQSLTPEDVANLAALPDVAQAVPDGRICSASYFHQASVPSFSTSACTAPTLSGVSKGWLFFWQ